MALPEPGDREDWRGVLTKELYNYAEREREREREERERGVTVGSRPWEGYSDLELI